MKLLITNLKEKDDRFLKSALARHPEVEVNIHRPGEDIFNKELYKDVVAVGNSSGANLDHTYFEFLKSMNIKAFAVRSAGYNLYDVKAARENGIDVANGRGYSPQTISELAIAMAMSFNRDLFHIAKKEENYDFLVDYSYKEMSECNVGIIGAGSIGTMTARLLKPMVKHIYAIANHVDPNKQDLLDYCDLETLKKNSDIIFLHLPYIPNENYHFVDEDFLKDVKNDVIIINMARGELVDLTAINKAIKNNNIKAYGTDVLENEKIYFKNKLEDITDPVIKESLSLYPRLLITPHVGANSDKANSMQLLMLIENCIAMAKHENCPNIIN